MCREDGRPGRDGASDDGEPLRAAAEALRMLNAALDFLNGDFLAGPGGAGLDSAGLDACDLGCVLESLGRLSAKFAAARAAILARFDAARGHDADGYGSSAAWLAAKGRTTRAKLRAADLAIGQDREQERLELVVGPVHLI